MANKYKWDKLELLGQHNYDEDDDYKTFDSNSAYKGIKPMTGGYDRKNASSDTVFSDTTLDNNDYSIFNDAPTKTWGDSYNPRSSTPNDDEYFRNKNANMSFMDKTKDFFDNIGKNFDYSADNNDFVGGFSKDKYNYKPFSSFADTLNNMGKNFQYNQPDNQFNQGFNANYYKEDTEGPSMWNVASNAAKSAFYDSLAGTENMARVGYKYLANNPNNSAMSWLDNTHNYLEGKVKGYENNLKDVAPYSGKDFVNQAVKGAVQVGTALLPGGLIGKGAKAVGIGGKALEAAKMLPFGVQAGGNYADDAEKDGATTGQQLAYGLVGIVGETASETMFGLSPLLKKFGKEGASKLINEGANTLIGKYGKLGASYLKNILGETAQEVMIDPVMGLAEKGIYNNDKALVGKDGVLDTNQMKQDAFGGFAMSVMLSALGLGKNTLSHRKASQLIENNITPTPEIINDIQNTIDTDIQTIQAPQVNPGNAIVANGQQPQNVPNTPLNIQNTTQSGNNYNINNLNDFTNNVGPKQNLNNMLDVYKTNPVQPQNEAQTTPQREEATLDNTNTPTEDNTAQNVSNRVLTTPTNLKPGQKIKLKNLGEVTVKADEGNSVIIEHKSGKEIPIPKESFDKLSPEIVANIEEKQVNPEGTYDIYRRDDSKADLSGDKKPHGMYYSLVNDKNTFKTPFEDVGDTDYWDKATPKNPLVVETGKIQHSRFKGVGGSGEISSGVSALKTLTTPQEFNKLSHMPKSQLVKELNEKFPGPDYSKYYDSYELLEAYGSQLARQKGHDAIIQEDKKDPSFSEYVSLNDEALHSKKNSIEKPQQEEKPVSQQAILNNSESKLSGPQAQLFNIVTSNLRRIAQEKNLDLNNFYKNTKDINAFNPSSKDVNLTISEFEKMFKNNEDAQISGYIQSLKKARNNISNNEIVRPQETVKEVSQPIEPLKETSSQNAPKEELNNVATDNQVLLNHNGKVDAGTITKTNKDGTVEIKRPEGDYVLAKQNGDQYESIKSAPTAKEDLPIDNRDNTNVGNRKIKAYQYLHPELKSHIQEDAQSLLSDLKNTSKGERGTKEDGTTWGSERVTSDDIAYLRDNYKMSYSDIEKGLKKLIEDDGSENNAASKKIELVIDHRLSNGYKDMMGNDIEANSDYVAKKNDIEGKKEKLNTEVKEEVKKPEKQIGDEVYVLNEKGLADSGKVTKINDDGTYDVVIEYPFGDATATVKKTNQNNNSYEIVKKQSQKNHIADTSQKVEEKPQENKLLREVPKDERPNSWMKGEKGFNDLSTVYYDTPIGRVTAVENTREFRGGFAPSMTTSYDIVLDYENIQGGHNSPEYNKKVIGTINKSELLKKDYANKENLEKRVEKYVKDYAEKNNISLIPPKKPPYKQTKEEFLSDKPNKENFTKIHENLIKKALNEGKAVPDEVLKDYPGLVKKEENQEGDLTKPTEETPKETNSWLNTVSKDDINYEKARNAYRAISFDPEKRAVSEQTRYVSAMQDIYEKMSKLAETPEQKTILEEELNKYKEKYLQHMNDILSAKSRTMSSMITGPANFPKARNEKALNSEHNKTVAFLEWQKKAESSIKKKLEGAITPEQATDKEFNRLKSEAMSTIATLKGIENGTEKGYSPTLFRNGLRDKLMRSLNNGNTETVSKVMDFIKEAEKEHLKKPVFTASNGIWKAVEVAKEKVSNHPEVKTGEEKIKEYEGASIVRNFDADRVQLFFDEKPSEEVRKELKSTGWNFSKTNGDAWQRKLTSNAEYTAKRIMDKHFKENIPNMDLQTHSKKIDFAGIDINALSRNNNNKDEELFKERTGRDAEEKDKKERQTIVNSFMNSEAIPQEVKDLINAHPEYEKYINYTPRNNEQTMEKAREFVNNNFTQAVAKIKNLKGLNNDMDTAIALEIERKFIKDGDFDSARDWSFRVAKLGTEAGRAVQYFSTLKRMTAEWTINHMQKKIDDTVTKKQADELEKKSNEVADKLNDVNKEVVEKVIEKVNKVVNKTTSSNSKSNNNNTTDPEEMLANKIANQLNQPERNNNPIKDMVNTLFKVAKQTLPKKDITARTPLEFIKEAMNNQVRYSEVWREARNIVAEEYADNVDARRALDEYFNQYLDKPFSDNQLSNAVKQGIKDIGIDLDKVVRQHYTVVNDIGKALSKVLTEKGLNKDAAEELATFIENEFATQANTKKESILGAIFKENPKATKKKEYWQKVIELSNMGAFSNEKYKDAVAEKYKINRLSAEATKKITELANKVQETKANTYENDKARAELLDYMDTLMKHGPLRYINAYQVVAMLTNPKTAARNYISNVMFSSLTHGKDYIRTGIDIAASKAFKTNYRTSVIPDRKTKREGYKEGRKVANLDYKNGINTKDINNKTELGRRKTFGKSTTNNAIIKSLDKGLGKVESIMNRIMDDRPFMQAAVKDSIRKQMKLAEMNGETFNLDNAIEKANEEGAYVTFNDKTWLSSKLSGLQRALNNDKDFGVGSIMLRFARTPANIFMRSIDYSPVSYFKAIYHAGKLASTKDTFHQEKFADDLAKAFTGTAMIGLGMFLAKAGALILDRDKDKDKNAFDKQTGIGNFKINISSFLRVAENGFNTEAGGLQKGDMLISFDWAVPMATSLIFGGQMQAAKTPGQAQSIGQNISDYFSAIGEATNGLLNQSMLQNISKVISPIDGDRAGAFADIVLSIPQSFVPSILNQLKQLTDNQTRELYDPNDYVAATNKAMNRVPGLSNNLPNKKDTLGRDAETYQSDSLLRSNNLFNVLLNPASITSYKPTPAEEVVKTIYDKTGNKVQFPRVVDNTLDLGAVGKVKLTSEEYIKYQEFMGKETEKLLNKYVNKVSNGKNDVNFLNKKASEIQQGMEDINAKAKEEIAKGRDIEKHKKGNKIIWKQK